jgi:hypothetical protein
LEEFRKAEIEMSKIDALEERIDETRNELESYIFNLQNGLERDFPEFFDPTKVQEYQTKLGKVQTWFSDNEFERLTIEEYSSQLKILKDIGEPAIVRRRTLQQLPSKVEELKDRALKALSRLKSTEEKFSHITTEERSPLQKELSDYSVWVDLEAKTAESKPKYHPISFDFGGAERKVTTLEQKVTTLLGKPKPPPPKPEPKAEPKPEPKAEEKKEEKREGTATATPTAEGEGTTTATPSEGGTPDGESSESATATGAGAGC